MFNWNVKRIHLATYPLDFRKQHQALLSEAFSLGLDLWRGDAIVFLNQKKTGIKILLADDTGIWVLYKKMSRGSIATRIEGWKTQSLKTISHSELTLLLEGAQYEIFKNHQKWSCKH